MSGLPLTAGLGIAVAAAWACSPPKPSPTDAGVDAGLSLSPVEVCDRISAARCELLARCYPAFLREAPESCRGLEQARCLDDYEALRPSFDAQTVEIDSAHVLACEERMKSSFCTPTFPPGYPAVAAHPFSDCELGTGLLKGKVPSLQICDRAVECAAGTLCVKPGGVCSGTCSSYSGASEACGFGCATGLYCEDQGTPTDPSDDRCTAGKGLGKPCTTSVECQADLRCSAGTCKARGSAGQACEFDPDRLSPCEPGLACDVTPFVAGMPGTCVQPVAQGEPCWFHWTCQPGLVCFDLDYTGFPGAAPAQPGSCQPPGPIGSNCFGSPYSTYVGDQCSAGTYCAPAVQKCTPVPSLGQGCTPSAQTCEGLKVYCKPSGSGDTGTCAGPANQGEHCAFAIDANTTLSIPCATGWCDTKTTLTCRPPNKGLGLVCAEDGECQSSRCAVQQDRSMRCAAACQ